MIQKIGHITILVKDYDEAIKFYTQSLGFDLKTDIPFGNKNRWVTVAPPKQKEIASVFVFADAEELLNRVGSQVANHVLLVIESDDCMNDYKNMLSKGVKFYGEPKEQPWVTEVVFEDLYGNRFDLLQPKPK